MNKSGSVLLIVILILTPLLLMSACLWRSTAYTVDLVHAAHTNAQRRALAQAGLLLVLKRLNKKHSFEHIFFDQWPDTHSLYSLEIKLKTTQQVYYATAFIYHQRTLVCSVSAHYYPDTSGVYRLVYDG